jgi:glutamyl-tRNA synthetase
MMDYNYLAELLFPDVTLKPEDIEARYPKRNLPEGAKVTRFAPSPTGYVHFGGLFPVTVSERLAHQSSGVFYLRIEDTDMKREVPGAKEALIRTLEHYGIVFDEGAAIGGDKGDYGPYTQTQRRDIYRVFAKKLVSEGKAYPVFTTEEELIALNSIDKKKELKERDWHEDDGTKREEMLKNRSITIKEVEEHIKAKHPFVLRMLADGDPEKRIKVTDLLRGTLEIPENDRDEVLLKSDGIPSYHFAHVVDDHLMGTTHVVRGEEWLPSLSRHIMLFRFLGFKPPKYLHVANLLRSVEEDGKIVKKKLSKRDMGANLNDYERLGYDPECVNEYVMTLLNSNYEEWHAANPDKTSRDFEFSIKKMSVSGCLFDINKLDDVSKNIVSRMTADEVYNKTLAWAQKFDPDFAVSLQSAPEMARAALAIGRGGSKPRKDFARWNEVKGYMGFFFDEYFTYQDSIPDGFDLSDVKTALIKYADIFDPADEQTIWFDKIKALASELGFAPETKLYKKDPSGYKGHVGDISMFIRIAVTGKASSPDLYEVMRILGAEKVKARLLTYADKIK